MKKPFLLLIMILLTSCASLNHSRRLAKPDPKICTVHHVRMQQEKVPIHYGLMARNTRLKKWWEAKQISFPNSNRYRYGGCVQLPSYPRKTYLYFCPRCREAEDTWKKENDYLIPYEELVRKCGIDPELVKLEDEDPIQAANENIKKGDRRFLGVYGYSVMVPGISQDPLYLQKSNQIRMIKDTTDAPRCRLHSTLQEVARKYAEKYNKVIFNNLNKSGKN